MPNPVCIEPIKMPDGLWISSKPLNLGGVEERMSIAEANKHYCADFIKKLSKLRNQLPPFEHFSKHAPLKNPSDYLWLFFLHQPGIYERMTIQEEFSDNPEATRENALKLEARALKLGLSQKVPNVQPSLQITRERLYQSLGTKFTQKNEKNLKWKAVGNEFNIVELDKNINKDSQLFIETQLKNKGIEYKFFKNQNNKIRLRIKNANVSSFTDVNNHNTTEVKAGNFGRI